MAQYSVQNPSFNQNTYHDDDQRSSRSSGFSGSCCISASLLGVVGAVLGGFVSLTTTTTSSTTTAMTTTRLVCNASCLNQSWVSSLNLLAEWSLDGNYADSTGSFNVTPSNNPYVITNGFIDQALSFSAASNQSLSSAYLPLFKSSFTVEVWLYPTRFPNIKDHSILGLCTSRNTSMCLHLTIRNIKYHRESMDSCCICLRYYHNATMGFMDELTVTRRAKSDCEISKKAMLMAYFPFNSGSIRTDSGPNSVSTIGLSYSIVSSGRSLQAISFAGTASSYFQTSSLTTASNGVDTWCLSFLGFAFNGTLVAQIYDGSSVSAVVAPTLTPLSPSWTHIVQTWSSTNGLRLYINNILVASRPSATTFVVTSTRPNFITLANGLSGSGIYATGSIGALGSYQGTIDDFRIYSRELTAADVCTLFSN